MLIGSLHTLRCSGCCRSSSDLSVWDKGFKQVMREAYAKGWITTHSDRYEGGDGENRAYCPYCAREKRAVKPGTEKPFRYCVE